VSIFNRELLIPVDWKLWPFFVSPSQSMTKTTTTAFSFQIYYSWFSSCQRQHKLRQLAKSSTRSTVDHSVPWISHDCYGKQLLDGTNHIPHVPLLWFRSSSRLKAVVIITWQPAANSLMKQLGQISTLAHLYMINRSLIRYQTYHNIKDKMWSDTFHGDT